MDKLRLKIPAEVWAAPAGKEILGTDVRKVRSVLSIYSGGSDNPSDFLNYLSFKMTGGVFVSCSVIYFIMCLVFGELQRYKWWLAGFLCSGCLYTFTPPGLLPVVYHLWRYP